MRRLAGSALVAIAMSVVLGATVSAGNLSDWSGTTLRRADGVTLEDAAFRDGDAAVVWREPGPDIWMRTSTDGGDSFAPRRLIAANAREAEADICGDEVNVAYARRVAGSWWARLSTLQIDSAEARTVHVYSGSGPVRHPDVACAGARVFVSWLTRSGDDVYVVANHALRQGGAFIESDPQSLGATQPVFGPPVMAGANGRAYLVRQVSADFITGPVIIHRWAVGGAVGAPVTDLGDRQLAPAGEFPGIDAVGDTVAVSWTDHSTGVADLWTRVSHDRGKTWGPRRKVVQAGTDTVLIVESIAIDGQRIVVSYVQASLFGGGDQRMLSTTTDFASVKDRRLSGIEDDLLLGWMTVPDVDHEVLVGAVDTGRAIRFVRRD